MAKKTVQELKQQGYKFPRTKWVFDRSPIYLLTSATAICTVGGIAWAGQQSLERIYQPYQPPSPYANVQASETPGIKWAKETIRQAPPGVSEWAVSDFIGASQPVTYKECNNFGLLPTSVLNTLSAKGENAEVFIQLYTPGQATQSFQKYQETFPNCWNTTVEKAGKPETTLVKYNGGVFFTYGDVIVFIKTNDPKIKESLPQYYLQKVPESLQEFDCKAINIDELHSKRNFFYDQKNYVGLYDTDKVKTKVKLTELPSPKYQKSKEYTYMEEPEGPLADSIPREPKKPFDKPVAAEIDTKSPPFEKELSFQIDDIHGPGCGWEWAGLKKPILDLKTLKNKEKEAYKIAYQEVDKNAKAWLDNKMSLTRNTILIMSQLNTWNNYVRSTEKVHDKWQWLINEREKIETPWYIYVDEHDYWLTFDYRKWEAKNQYEQEVQQCNARKQELKEWEDKWGELAKQYQNQGVLFFTQNNYSIQNANYIIPKDNSIHMIPAAKTNPPVKPKPQETKPPVVSPPTPKPTEIQKPTNPPTNKPETEAPQVPVPQPTETPKDKLTETPTPTIQIPPRPEGCDYTPEKPSIMSQSKPAEPQPPKLKEGVTIPYSWTRPKTDAPRIPRN